MTRSWTNTGGSSRPATERTSAGDWAARIGKAAQDIPLAPLTAGVLLTAGVATLLALPWSNKDITRIDTAFRSVGDITQDSLPLHTLG